MNNRVPEIMVRVNGSSNAGDELWNLVRSNPSECGALHCLHKMYEMTQFGVLRSTDFLEHLRRSDIEGLYIYQELRGRIAVKLPEVVYRIPEFTRRESKDLILIASAVVPKSGLSLKSAEVQFLQAAADNMNNGHDELWKP